RDRACERELAGGADAVVVTPARESHRIPSEVTVLEGIDAEARRELERDGLDARHQARDFVGAQRPRRRVALDGGGEDLELEARPRDVLAVRVAPRAPGVPELESDGQST